MGSKILVCIAIIILIISGSCSTTRYMTDKTSIERQHDMKLHRTGGNVGDVFINMLNLFISASLNSRFEVYSGERAFKRISLHNESADTLYINMVTDIVWKKSGYCDIMGIVLPPAANQKLLVPYPAAYNVYFKTPYSEEEKLEIRTDSRFRIIKLKPGMTNLPVQVKPDDSGQSQ